MGYQDIEIDGLSYLTAALNNIAKAIREHNPAYNIVINVPAETTADEIGAKVREALARQESRNPERRA